MPSGDLIKELFRKYRDADYDGFYSTAMQIIQEEKKKNHHILAQDLKSILENNKNVKISTAHGIDFKELPKEKDQGTLLVDARTPNRFFPDIILSKKLKEQVEILLREFRKREIIKTYSLQPRSKLLFAGPPGCGKSLCAEVIAGELGLPLLYTRFDSVISSYLGETASNLRKVFDFASNGTWVVFFDEFDAIGKSRNNLSEHGELKRVVNTFLQLLDNFKSDSLFIAATNHEHLLDKALWRRFDDILFFDYPTKQQIPNLIQIKLNSFPYTKLNIESFINQLHGWSHSDIEQVCFESIKICILEDLDEISNDVFQKALIRQKNRKDLIRKTQNK